MPHPDDRSGDFPQSQSDKSDLPVEVKSFLGQQFVSLDDFRVMEAKYLEATQRADNYYRALPTMSAPGVDPWATFELRYGGYVYVKRSHARRGIARALAAAGGSK